ncbi:hypothetical protein V8C86DRAFT_1109065 [Haematococcus lacustris]
MLAGAPGLSRAVCECTQPYGPLSNEPMRSLQRFLVDSKSTDNVYKALILRASADPFSLGVVEKVLAIIKHLVFKHPPSPEVGQLLEELCAELRHVLDTQPSCLRTLQYVATCLARLRSPPDVLLQPPKTQAAAGRSTAQGPQTGFGRMSVPSLTTSMAAVIPRPTHSRRGSWQPPWSSGLEWQQPGARSSGGGRSSVNGAMAASGGAAGGGGGGPPLPDPSPPGSLGGTGGEGTPGHGQGQGQPQGQEAGGGQGQWAEQLKVSLTTPSTTPSPACPLAAP